jgi:hypothetical protein
MPGDRPSEHKIGDPANLLYLLVFLGVSETAWDGLKQLNGGAGSPTRTGLCPGFPCSAGIFRENRPAELLLEMFRRKKSIRLQCVSAQIPEVRNREFDGGHQVSTGVEH